MGIPRRLSPAGKLTLFGIVAIALLAAHFRDLRLPYFWDEAGYFVPAALDLFSTGDPIPHSVPPNPHPPLVMATLAAAWHLFGFSPLTTRLTMLCWAAAALLAVYALGELLSGFQLGIACCICTFLYPVFFAQSSLAQLDLPAAAMTLWGLIFYARGKLPAAALFLSAAALSKESAAVAAILLLLVESLSMRRARPVVWKSLATLALPLVVLAAWLLYLYARTGTILGNSEFSRYNVTSTILAPSRLAAAFLHRLWDTTGHFFLFLLVLPAVVPLIPKFRRGRTREGNRVPLAIALMIAFYIVVFSFLGGAVLARYMLTAVTLVIVLSLYLTACRWRYWWTLVPVASIAFLFGLVYPPPYHYAYDENLAYRSFIDVHRQAAAFLSAQRAAVITAWPATDELSKPFLGYVPAALNVIALPDLSLDSVTNAAKQCRACAILFFPTQYEPAESILRPGAILRRFEFWKDAQRRFETRPATLTAEALAAALGARITWRSQAGPVYAAVLRQPG